MLYIFILALLIVHIYLCSKSLAYGCACYIAIKIILPTPTRLFGISIYALMIIILLLFTILKISQWKKNNNRIKQAIIPFIYLIIPIAILGVGGELDYVTQYKKLIQFSITEICPYFLLMIGITQKEELYLCIKILVVSYIIIALWGIVSYVIRLNVYVLYFADAFGYSGELFVGDGSEAVRGMLASRATGNQSEGAIPWGQISLVMLSFGLFFRSLIPSPKIRYIFISLAIVNCFLSTKRSVIAPMLFLLMYVAINKGLFTRKHFMKIIMSILVLYLIIVNNSTLLEIYHANIETSLFFWNDDLIKDNNFTGSSTDMRFTQAIYVNNLISNHFLTGLGYGYPDYHIMRYGGSTEALFFESLYLHVIASSGYIGLLVWMLFFLSCMKMTKGRILNKMDNYALHGGYIISILLTNIYCSFAYYMILVALFAKYRQLSLSVASK